MRSAAELDGIGDGPPGRGRLTGRVAVVTGAGAAAGGWSIGQAIATLFAREGARVLAVDADAQAAQATRAGILAEGGQCDAWGCDVTQSAQAKRMAAVCMEHFDRVDVLVNNVSLRVTGGPVEQREEDWDRMMATNTKSMFLTCKHVLPLMERSGGGAVVNLSSVASLRWGGIPAVAFAASNAAVNQFSRVVGMQYARSRVRVNTILPGLIDMPALDDVARSRVGMLPMGRLGSPWEIATVATFLASDEAGYITGAELVVDGGLTWQVFTPQ